MRFSLQLISCLIIGLAIVYSCTKDKGRDPDLAYSDRAFLDSCRNEAAFVYYKNDPSTIYAGTNGAHGTYKLKFNHIAYAQLVDAGKLPVGAVFSDGSMVVKEIIENGSIGKYAIMYKRNGVWLWGEWTPELVKNISVKDNSSACTNCHKQAGNRDLVNTFTFH